MLLTLALLLVTYRFARLGAAREEALLAVLLLLASVQFFYQAIVPQQDIALTLFLSVALYAYFVHRRTGEVAAAVGAGVSLALAVLSKGVVSVVLFGIVAAGDLLLAWRRREADARPRWRTMALGGVVSVLVAAPRYVAGTIQEGKQFLEVQLGEAGALRYFQSYAVGLDPEGHFVNYYLQQWVAHNGDETRLPEAWGAGRVFAVLTPRACARLRDRIAPRVLLRTPGLVLVTNR